MKEKLKIWMEKFDDLCNELTMCIIALIIILIMFQVKVSYDKAIIKESIKELEKETK